MREDFLHYIWKYKKFAFAKALTTTGETLTLTSVGQHNHLAGPDFFNARLHISDQEWAGNVEIHNRSSDWYAHGHETDPNYDTVILHVVWEHDIDIYRADNSALPTLELKAYIHEEALHNYQELFDKSVSKWIQCEPSIGELPTYIWEHWQERLYIERLQRKTISIQELLKKYKNDWERVLFIMLSRSFGTKINGEAFQSLAQHIDFNVIRKNAQESFRLEALFMGAGNLLPEESTDSYVMQLQGAYEYVKHKFQINVAGVLPIQFYKLRPHNFPTIRLSQLAMLYHRTPNLFQRLMESQTLSSYYTHLSVTASEYWETHFSFGTSHKKRSKKLSTSFIDLLLINTIIPLKFAYYQYLSKENNDEIFDLIRTIKPEKNSVITRFDSCVSKATNAMHTQARIQLKSEYCSKYHCLQCEVGNWMITRK